MPSSNNNNNNNNNINNNNNNNERGLELYIDTAETCTRFRSLNTCCVVLFTFLYAQVTLSPLSIREIS